MLHSRLEAEMLARTMRTGRSVRQNIALRVADAVTGAGMDDAYARLGSGRDWAVARREEAFQHDDTPSCTSCAWVTP